MAVMRVDSSLEHCLICLVTEKINRNFGAITCSPCASFFRRTVGLKIKYVCKYTNNCNVELELRNGCRSCRFAKCEAIGMKKELVQSQGEREDRLPEYIRRGRQHGEEEVTRGFATSIYFRRSPSPSDSKTDSGCTSPALSSTGSSSSVCPILDVTPEELLSYYVEQLKKSISHWSNVFDASSMDDFLQLKNLSDQNAWSICLNCPGVDLLSEEEIPTLLRYCSFSNIWLDSAWRAGCSGCSELEASCFEPFKTLISQFNSTISKFLSTLDLVEYSALKAICIWKLALMDSTLTFKIVAQEQYYNLTQGLSTYYRSERKLGEMEIAVRIADITLLLGPIFEAYCEVMRFYDNFNVSESRCF